MNVELRSGPMRVERQSDGRRRLLRKLVLRIDSRDLEIPRDFVTDFSSWPRLLPGPAFHRIDVAGVAHDFLFKVGKWGYGGERIGFVAANRVWFAVARAGESPRARAGWLTAWAGRVGLLLCSWPVWMKYRRANPE
jgi:hypothetical protein